jgi:D-threonate/D-erythronate kinase
MTELAIIADDLTGALDAAAPFAMRGLKTVVALSPAALAEAVAAGARVVGVSTDSREVDPDTASDRTQQAVQAIGLSVRLFKKVDSRLKGNVAAELDVLAYDRSLVVPAIPEFGRFVKDGKLFGFGIDTPIDVREALGQHADRSVVPDVASTGDVEAALKEHPEDLAVGARTLADAMAAQMAQKPVEPATRVAARRAIFVLGSRDPITLAQIERLRGAFPNVAYLAAPGGAVGDGVAVQDEVIIVHATQGQHADAPGTVACRLADGLLRAGSLEDTLVVLSGGATAQVVLGQMEIGLVEVLGEVLPGLPIAQTLRFKLITKSGGFGEPDALVKIVSQCIRRSGT